MIDLEKLREELKRDIEQGDVLYEPTFFLEVLDKIAALEKDAGRWRMVPAFLEDHQIDYVRLVRDIDTAMESKHG